MQRLLALPLLFAILLWPCTADASYAGPKAKGYIQLSTPHAVLPDMLTPPPAENSAAWEEQVARVLDAQDDASEADKIAAREEQRVEPEMVSAILGPGFTRAALPRTFRLLDRAGADIYRITERAKVYWGTRRPFVADSRVKLMIDSIANKSYPSGHTSISRVWAEILAGLLPARKKELLARADAIAWHRVQAGVHYPADLAGGRQTALYTINALRQDKHFMQDFAAAQAELAAAGY
ncbi:MAG: phosphatase PAP2 family protein [Alphaproteobacteria bacterium]|nr:phosphatase PAP2 family protein [Alphaproteobacteria bacterium]